MLCRKSNASFGTRRSCDKQEQAMTTLPSTMGTSKAIINGNGGNQCHHCDVPKYSWDGPLLPNKEGRGDQPWSHKTALPTNATRASWVSQQYSSCNDNHPHRSVNRQDTSMTNTTQTGWTQLWSRWPFKQGTSDDLPQQAWGVKQNMQQRTCKQDKNTKPSWHVCHASRAQQSLDKQQRQFAWQC